uniref:Uncharacterized protein n=1 Tax=Callorhinchus milii TaxID=7868 RepID=A0A4W3KIG3_CALMI
VEMSQSELYRAAAQGDLPGLERALDRAPDLSSALHLAVMSDSPSLVHLLLEKGMDPNITGAGEQTPLHLAARHDRYKMVDVLIGAGSKPNSAAVLGATPLHVASRWGSRQAAERLIANKNVWRRTALHLAAEHGSEDLVELLLMSGGAIDALDNAKDTPLHCACRSGNVGAAHRLANWAGGQKAKFHVTNNVRKTPLQVSESGDSDGHRQIVVLLRKKMMLTR